MAAHVDPNDGFPHERVSAAKKYLYAVKPWWARFGERMVIVPTYTSPRDGATWGAMTSTDQHLRLYVDRTFATVAPFHILSGAIEHEFQHHTHDTWKRLRWMSPDEWRDWANIVLDLEINSVIDTESTRLDIEVIHSALKESVVFTQKDMRIWGVTEPPGLGDMGWIPRAVGLPDGLSAEEYYRLINKPDDAYDNDTASSESGEYEQSDRDNGSERSNDSESGSAPSNAESEKDNGDAPESNAESGDQSDTELDEGSVLPLERPEALEGNGESSDKSENDRSDGDQIPDHSEDPDQSDSDSIDLGPGNPNSGSQEGSGEGQSQPENGDAEQVGTGAGDTESPDGSLSDGLEPSSADIIEEMRSDPINQMWAAEIENPSDPLSDPSWKPDDPPPGPTPGEIAEALSELEEDIHSKQSIVPGFGLDGAGRIVKWAEDHRKARGIHWTDKFEKLASSSLNSAKIHGQTDMSYTVRNPNQPVLGPIMMGMHGYSLVVYVLQDVSGSMLMQGSMKRAMTVFTEICAAITERFGSNVTWVSADREVRDVGKTTRWSEDIRSRWSWGFGGTDFGNVIGDIMHGKLTHKGKRYPKPDILIVSSDCLFDWPESRPRGCKILVVNVGDPARAEEYLPTWLNRKREFVQVE